MATPKALRSSRYAGVTWSKDRQCWRVYIVTKRPYPHSAFLGSYSDERKAGAAYDLARIAMGLEPVNHPPQLYAGVVVPERASAFDEVKALVGCLRVE